jgi:hypothetical protein
MTTTPPIANKETKTTNKYAGAKKAVVKLKIIIEIKMTMLTLHVNLNLA